MENQITNDNIPKHWPMSWFDLSEHHISRFRLEEAGRSYAADYTGDCITDVFRKIYLSFPRAQRLGYDPIDMTTKVSVSYNDLNNAMAESLRRTDELNAEHSKRYTSTSTGTLNLQPHPSNNPN